LKLLGEENVTDYYAHFGKTKFNMIKQLIFLKRWYRTKFIEKNFQKNIDINIPFVYYPLHVDPERQTLIVAPFLTNQIENITHIAKSLPPGYKLFVKEHGMMEIVGWRSISYYKEIMNLPNIELIHPKVDPQMLLDSCSLVVTINGTTGFEALFYKKPVIAFSNVSYATVSGVSIVNKIDELPKLIKSSLKNEVNLSELNDYINLVERNTFEMDMTSLYLAFGKSFSKEYHTAKSSMSVPQIKKFIENNDNSFNTLAKAHIEQMIKHKERDM
jgi:capsule polysaccharide modification protein KpsS